MSPLVCISSAHPTYLQPDPVVRPPAYPTFLVVWPMSVPRLSAPVPNHPLVSSCHLPLVDPVHPPPSPFATGHSTRFSSFRRHREFITWLALAHVDLSQIPLRIYREFVGELFGGLKMSGMGDGYVGTAQDAARIRRLEKQREVERKRIQELKNKSSGGQTGLLQFGSGSSEILENAFKKETVGLVTREQYVEKRVNLRSKIEEEEKEKLQKLQQEEEELQKQKRKKRRAKTPARLSFIDEMENETDEEENGASENGESKKHKLGTLGKDPTVETSFLPDREREAEDQTERERLRKQWMEEQKRIKNEPLEITYSYWDGAGHRRVIQVRKGDTIADFLRAVQQQLASEFREIRTASVENLLYVKEDLIIPHQHSFYELIINKARGKSGPLFHFDVHEDIRTIADATIEKDESHAGKVVERHWYEKNKHIFPASRWEIYDPTKRWERYTIHGD